MAQSVRWPMQRTASGGAAKTATPGEATKQIITISVIPGKSQNPWALRAGLGAPGDTYDISGIVLSGASRDFLTRRFLALERTERARLEGEPVVRPTDGNGKRDIFINYFDLEMNRVESAEVSDGDT